MNYMKPEIALLGEASRVILKKQRNTEIPGQTLQKVVADCELDS
jgi:hypothetical protein